MNAAMTVTLGLLVFLTTSSPARAQDPVPIYPENYKVLFENDRTRVIDFRLARGAKEMSHAHPAHVVHVLAPFRIRFTFPDGSTKVREAKAGDILFSDPVTHASENIGDTDAHGILVELKEGPAASARAAELGLLTAVTFIEGRPGREDELKKDLLALAAPTRAESGCRAYDLYQSPQKPNRFMRYELWRDAAALEAHKATPHIRASFERRDKDGWATEITTWRRVPEDAAMAASRPEPPR
jgi:quinol monooxygenase YgiN/quercetin dioxygenase-like cupin family protein